MQDLLHGGESALRQGVTPGQVHVFEVLGQKLALDVATGSLHLVDDVAAHVIARHRHVEENHHALRFPFKAEAVREAEAEVAELIQRGLLFTPDPVPPVPNLAPPVKALCMNISHDCDLTCGYCFAQQGDFGGERTFMTDETATGAIDCLVDQAKTSLLAVDFFGGEPLLNLPAMEAAVARCRDWERRKDVRFIFTVTTNGTLLDGPVREFLDRESIRVVLSLDGRPEVHDRFRKTCQGGGSYKQVIDNMRRLIEDREPDTYYARGTYTRHNLDFSQDVLHMVDMGFSSVSLEPVVSDPSCPWALTEEDVPTCRAEYERLCEIYLERHRQGRPFTFFHFAVALDHGPCLPKRLRGCGAGTEYLAVAPDGRFFPCHQFVGQEQFCLGDVIRGLTGHEVRADMARIHALNKSECSRCWARYHCGGGCHANAYQFSGDMKKPYTIGCQLQRHRLECALYVQAILA